jgi:hypothetical protein
MSDTLEATKRWVDRAVKEWFRTGADPAFATSCPSCWKPLVYRGQRNRKHHASGRLPCRCDALTSADAAAELVASHGLDLDYLKARIGTTSDFRRRVAD